jgi:hypothetical protein
VEDIGRRGAFVGFGNTSPCTRADVYFGLAQRGVNTRALLPPGVVATFRPALYTHRRRLAYVAYKKPDYAHALSRSDTDLLMLCCALRYLVRRLERAASAAGGAALPTRRMQVGCRTVCVCASVCDDCSVFVMCLCVYSRLRKAARLVPRR